MCGIAGIYRFAKSGNKPVKALELERMCAAMAHRGPDQQGIRLFGDAGLGFRRLKIIDLSANADQPMANEDESLWLVFNGEIYNFKTLRHELEQQGHRFRSQSDSEVLLHGFEQWGEQLLGRLEGMFALALYRPRDRYLLLARDGFGIKPLYLFEDGGGLAFASEIKALLALGTVGARVNLAALPAYLALGYVPTPDTLFAGVRKLPPGSFLEIRPAAAPRLQNFWDLHEEPARAPHSLAALEEDLKRNVGASLVSDVPLGVFLSGGLDSALLTLYAQRNSPQPVKTFSIGFAGFPHFDETAKSDFVAGRLGTDHHSLKIEEEAAAVLPKAVRALEEPLADPSIIPTYHLAAMTKGFVTVALSGEGGDELFGGYGRYLWEPRAEWAKFTVGWWAPLLLPLLEAVPTPHRVGWSNRLRRIRKFLRTCKLGKAERYLAWFALLDGTQRAALLKPAAARGSIKFDGPRELFASKLLASPFRSNLRRLQYVDTRTMLLDDLLLKADKIGMAHGLEMRVPLLNRSAAEMLFNLPDSLKINGNRTKVAERELLRKEFGEDFAAQGKQGFEVPIGDWLRGRGQSLLHELLQPAYLEHGLFDTQVLANIHRAHMQGERDFGLGLFAVAVFNLWFREFGLRVP